MRSWLLKRARGNNSRLKYYPDIKTTRSKYRLILQMSGALRQSHCGRGRRGHEVHGRLNGFHFESYIVPRQKRFFMIIDEDIRKQAKLSVGDIVTSSVKPLVK